jgi:hypothetical protein
MTNDDALTRDLEQKLGDPDLVKSVRDSIVELRDGAGGAQLAEMARDLLDGRASIRDIARSSAYAEPLSAAGARYKEWFKSLEPEDRERLLSEVRGRLAQEASDGGPRTGGAD